MARVIKSEAEFVALIEEVDAELRSKHVAIPARELLAFSLVAQKLDVELRGFPRKEEPTPGSYGAEDLPIRIIRWMRERYGDRLKMDFSPGTRLLDLRGNLWAMRLPLIYGHQIRLVSERDLSKKYPTLVVYKPGTDPGPLIVNVLSCIQELPQGLASTLTNEECNRAMQSFIQGHRAFYGLDRFRRTNPLADHAARDLTQSSRYAIDGPDAYGQSRWSALQSAEKSLKLFLDRKGKPFPKGKQGHDLHALARLAETEGLPKIDPTIIRAAQCDAGERYVMSDPRIEQVLEANRAAVVVAFVVTSHLTGTPGLRIQRITTSGP